MKNKTIKTVPRYKIPAAIKRNHKLGDMFMWLKDENGNDVLVYSGAACVTFNESAKGKSTGVI